MGTTSTGEGPMGTGNETGAGSRVHEEGKGVLVWKQREWGEPEVATEYEREQKGGGSPAVTGMWAFGRSRERGEGRGGAPTTIHGNR